MSNFLVYEDICVLNWLRYSKITPKWNLEDYLISKSSFCLFLMKPCTQNSHSKVLENSFNWNEKFSRPRKWLYPQKIWSGNPYLSCTHFFHFCSIMFSLRSISAKRSLWFQFQTTVSLFSPCLFVWARAL